MKEKTVYQKVGIDIDEANKALDLMKPFLKSTHNKRVIEKDGLFVGLIKVGFLKEYQSPVLALSNDGVGHKMVIAKKVGRFDTVGEDVISHCVNDVITVGAELIAFLDYVSSAKLKAREMKEVSKGMARVCQKIGCQKIKLPIVAGETAELPYILQRGRHELVGTIVGVVEEDEIIDGSAVKVGDVIIALPSNGLHTNGYTLALILLLKIAGYNVNTPLKELGCTIGEELLRPHKCYFKPIHYLTKHYRSLSKAEIHAIAHITGGGLYDNIGRLLPDGLQAEIDHQWSIPPIFQIIQRIGKIPNREMRRVFNLGIGMVLIVPKEFAEEIRNVLFHQGEPDSMIIGRIKKSKGNKEKVIFTYD